MRQTKTVLKVFLVAFFMLGLNPCTRSQTIEMAGYTTYLQGNCYELIPRAQGNLNKEAAIWNQESVDFSNDFSMCFMAHFGNNTMDGADGMVWVLKANSTAQTGGYGSKIGYKDLPTPNLGVEFDTYFNDPSIMPYINAGDIPDDHIAIMKNGDQANPLVSAVPAVIGGGNIEDVDYHQIKINWDASSTTLDVYFDGVLRSTLTQDIVSTIFNNQSDLYWGITSSTGGDWNRHRVCLDCCSENLLEVTYDNPPTSSIPHNDIAYSIKGTSDAGLVIGGSTEAIVQYPHPNPVILKDDGTGTLLWQNKYRYEFNPAPNQYWLETGEILDVEMDRYDFILACGYVDNVNEDAIVMKSQPDGTPIWSTVIFEDPYERAYDVEPVDDGTVAWIGTMSEDLLVGNLSGFNGSENWTWIISGDYLNGASRDDEIDGFSIQPIDESATLGDLDTDQEDGYVICGNLYLDGNRNEPSAFYAKLDEYGAVVWFKIIEDATAYSITQIYDNAQTWHWDDSYVMTGEKKFSGPTGDSYAYVVIIDDNGNITQTTSFGKSGLNTVGKAIEQLPDLSFGVTGTIGNGIASDPFLANVDFSGSLVWDRAYGELASEDAAFSVEWMNTCQLIFAGYTNDMSSPDFDMYVVKGDINGTDDCSERPSNFSLHQGSITATNYPTLSLAHWSVEPLPVEATPLTFTSDVCSPLQQVPHPAVIGEETMVGNDLIAYPNPTTNEVDLEILYNSAASESLSITVVDVQGKVHMRYQEMKSAGGHPLSIETEKLVDGMYILTIEGQSGRQKVKFMIENR